MRLCRVLDVEVRPNPRTPFFTFITMSFSERRQSFGSANKGNCPICLFDGSKLSHGIIKSRNHASTTIKDKPFTSGAQHSLFVHFYTLYCLNSCVWLTLLRCCDSTLLRSKWAAGAIRRGPFSTRFRNLSHGRDALPRDPRQHVQ
jgi:hypothetical protein